MSLFQFILIIVIVLFAFFGYDAYKRKQFNILYFGILFFGIGLLTVFTLDNNLLNAFGSFFGIARGADLLVYLSIVFLTFLYIHLLNKQTKSKYQLTRLISQLAIHQTFQIQRNDIEKYKNTTEKDNYIFNIRVYNEGKIIGKVIDEVIKFGFKKLLLVNDGSCDNTLEILEQKQQQYPTAMIIIISHLVNRGGGAANQTGYNFVKKYYEKLGVKRFVGFDADGQMDITDMDKFSSVIKKTGGKIGLYLGSRFVAGARVENMPLSRKIILKISKLVTRIMYGIHTSDPHNGYRVMSIEVLKKFHITADGMHYANELNEQINKQKIPYQEIPVNIRYTDYSLSKGQKNSNSIKLAFEMIYKKIFFR